MRRASSIKTIARLLFAAAFALIAVVGSFRGVADAQQANAHSVLLIGGRGTMGSAELTSGDFYDASAQSFSAAAGVAPNRLRYSATRLNDGRILIAGGFDPQGPSKQASLLDPAAKSLKAAPDMMCGHGFHSATLLGDGRVLIAGASISDDLSSDCAEIYDPAANRFQLTGKLNVSRLRHIATLLPDGKVLIAGGAHTSGGINHALNSAEIFDPKTGRFTLTKSRMHARRDDLSAVLLGDGEVLIAGGYDDKTEMMHTAEIFDPASATFKTINGRVPISVFNLVMLKDGKVLMAGEDARVVIFDPAGAAFTVAPGHMHNARTVYSATLLDDGQVLFAGGRGIDPDRVLDNAELFNPSSGTFTRCKNKLSGPRMEHLAISLTPRADAPAPNAYRQPNLVLDHC